MIGEEWIRGWRGGYVVRRVVGVRLSRIFYNVI